jgi:hypothetical protein
MKEMTLNEVEHVSGGEPISLGVAAAIIVGGLVTGAVIAWLAS